MAEDTTGLADSQQVNIEEAPALEAEEVSFSPKKPQIKKPSYNIFLFVSSGVHEGATFELEQKAIIGSSFESDLILTDDSVEESHASLEVIETRFGYEVEVKCLGTTLLINRKEKLEKDKSQRMSSTFTLKIGDVELKVLINTESAVSLVYQKYIEPKIDVVKETVEVQAKRDFKAFFLDRRNQIMLALAASFVILLSYTFYFSIEKTPEYVAPKDPYSSSKNPVSIYKIPSEDVLERAKRDLTSVLEQYNIASRMSLTIEDRTLYANGILNPVENEKWRAAQNWFDLAYATKVDLISLIKINYERPQRISFKAVYTGGKPFVVSWTGERYRVGSVLPEGWVIKSIQKDGVVLTDNDRTLVVKYKPF